MCSSVKATALHSSRSFLPALGGVTPKTASLAFAEARWCDHGHTPQMLVTIRGSSSTGRPMQNFSKPRSSTTLTKVSATLPLSSRSIVTLACPSILVTGASVILVMCLAPYFFGRCGSGLSRLWPPTYRFSKARLSATCLASNPMDEMALIMSTMGFAPSRMGPKHPRHGM